MAVDPALQAFEVIGESMAASADFSTFVHFSNKIIKSIRLLLINGKSNQNNQLQPAYS